MTTVRHVTHIVVVAALATIGVLLILESAEAIGGRWRRELATGVSDVAFPSWGLWASGLVGACLAVLGVILLAAQVAPRKKGLNTMHEVYKGSDGETRLRGRAAISAVRHEVASIDGVVDVDARLVRKQMHVEVQVDDRVNLTDMENEVRGRLDHGFWIDLGLADFALNLLITHHPTPPRAR